MKKYPILYQRANNGKINTFEIIVNKDYYYTVTGYFDGKKVQSSPTKCYEKSYCTAQEQALKEAEALHRKKLELGFYKDINDIDTSTLFKPMLAVDFNEYKDKIKYPVYVQPKLDGIRCIVRKDGMWSRNGKAIISAPHIYDTLSHLFNENPNLVIDGELYIHSNQNDFNTICSLVKKTKPTEHDLAESARLIEYWIYDVPSHKATFDHRKVSLHQFKHFDKIKVVTTSRVNNEDELKEQYGMFMSEGYEGLMVRTVDGKYENKRSKNLLKYKTFHDNEYIILDVYEGKGRLANKVGQMLFKNEDGKEFYSTVNGTEEYLTELWLQKDQLIGKLATIKYFELTIEGIPRFPKVINVDRFDI